ncbi:MAG: YlbF family regulator [Clostridia bacterium]|nr:YlbF family regulator [Clostridia bacterium]
MTEIIEKTRELGEMIRDSAEMKKLKEAEANQAQDENAKTLMMEFNMNRMNLGRDLQSGKLTEEEAIKRNNEAFENMVAKSDAIREYVEAKKELDRIVTEVNEVLNFYITGHSSGCSHDCSSCGGCH